MRLAIKQSRVLFLYVLLHVCLGKDFTLAYIFIMKYSPAEKNMIAKQQSPPNSMLPENVHRRPWLQRVHKQITILTEIKTVSVQSILLHYRYCKAAQVAQWHSGKTLDLRSIRHGFNSHEEEAALQTWASCSHLCASVTKQYNLVLVEGW